MKKLIVIVAVGMSILTSCKKDWTCECSVNGIQFSSTPLKDMSKSDAESECNGGGSYGGYTINCELNK